METSLWVPRLRLWDPLNDGRPGLNFLGLRSVRGAAEQRFNPANWLHSSLHPNERGHAALLRAFQTWTAEQTARSPCPARLPVPAEASARLAVARQRWASPSQGALKAAEATETKAGPCDLFASD